MTNLHIISKCGQITKCDEHLHYKDYEGNITRILPSKTKQILVYSPVSITGEAFTILAKNKIPLAIKTYNGVDNIVVQYNDGKNVFLRQKQFQISENMEKSLEIAKKIVLGKIKNQITFLQRIKRTEKLSEEYVNTINEVKLILKDVEKCNSLEALRGLEGMASRKYFSIYGIHIKPEWAIFEKRSKNPPKSNVNAVMSFLYSLLSQEVAFAAQTTGLDLMVGTLHSLCYGRDSLVYDLMEEFRTPIADTLCCYLFNDNILNEDDFEEIENGIYLTKSGMKKVINAFEEKMQKSILYGDKYFSYREIIFNQVEQYKDYIMNNQEDYIAFQYK